jgi:hypothetical protein
MPCCVDGEWPGISSGSRTGELVAYSVLAIVRVCRTFKKCSSIDISLQHIDEVYDMSQHTLNQPTYHDCYLRDDKNVGLLELICAIMRVFNDLVAQ